MPKMFDSRLYFNWLGTFENLQCGRLAVSFFHGSIKLWQADIRKSFHSVGLGVDRIRLQS